MNLWFTNKQRQTRVPKIHQKPVDKWVYTTCGYCSTGCGIELGVKDGKAVTVRGKADHPVNQGKLCLKGIWEFEVMTTRERGEYPLSRKNRNLPMERLSWDQVLDHTAFEFSRIMKTYGKDALAVVSTGQIYTEEFYTLGKLVRGGLGTNNYDGNTTLCMASAVSGYKKSFGSDGPPGCYDDFEHTECLLAFGSNLVECHPIIYYRLKTELEKRHFPVIVIDPRVTTFAQMADIHLPILPGTDVVLLNALAHVILEERLHKEDYIASHTKGFSEFRSMVLKFSPAYAEKITGIPRDTIIRVARIYGKAKSATSIWTMGINQSTHGTDGVVAINNLALITGNIGRPGGTSLSITGQCNAMGTREFSSCSGLPAYRQLENPEHREEIARLWGLDESIFPAKRGLQMTDIFPEIEKGIIKGLWLIATNPMTSMADTGRIEKILNQLEFLVVQDVYYSVESAKYADVYLPAAMWSEKTGTFTNTERRVNLVEKAIDPPGEAKPDLDIFIGLAEKMGLGPLMKSKTPEAVFAEMGEVSKGRLCDYSGMTYDLLKKHGGIQWPARSDLGVFEQSSQYPQAPLSHRQSLMRKPGFTSEANSSEGPGTRRLYSDGKFASESGKANLIPLDFIDNNERPDLEYPFWLNTGRVIEHWHTRTKTGKIGNLNKFSPVPYVEMHPGDARRLDLSHMDHAQMESRRGKLKVMVQLTERVAPGMVFIPFHFAKGANLLTLGLLDPYSRQPAYKQCAVKIAPVNESGSLNLNHTTHRKGNEHQAVPVRMTGIGGIGGFHEGPPNKIGGELCLKPK
ncbi:MAG: nitrate reductase [Nitrospirae bacterium]|nr:nitrate reductase [Nitrospirota bacterium]